MSKSALGRGLGALLGGPLPADKTTSAAPSSAAQEAAAQGVHPLERVRQVALDRIRRCPFQPRKEFTPEALQELADSIREQGIIQPLLVRERQDAFELIAGERRWRAAQLAGLAEVPVLVREAGDREVLEMALIENLQRENLNPIEEAQGYEELIRQFQLRQEDVAAKVGKSRAVVTNALRLLKLVPEIQNYIREGRLSVGHAKVILSLEDPRRQKLAADRILKHGLSVRRTEEFVGRLLNPAKPASAGSQAPSAVGSAPEAAVADLENKLRERLGTKVHLRYRQGKGALEIRFFSDDDLQRILQVLGVQAD
ncbi:MAG: ParB/RepB/Spo0J family partition protein [Verrucomicrobia bacterium]|nr:ParB/RepB/Spo0J family partition protein [Verrucomicrobiota bacterium]